MVYSDTQRPDSAREAQSSGASWSGASLDAVPAVPLSTDRVVPGAVAPDVADANPRIRKMMIETPRSYPDKPDRPVKKRKVTHTEGLSTNPIAKNVTGSFEVSMVDDEETVTASAGLSELVVSYSPSAQSVETALTQQLRDLDPREILLRRYFRWARHVMADVGQCAADLIWRHALVEVKTKMASGSPYEVEASKNKLAENNASRIHYLLSNWAFAMPNLDHTSVDMNVTPKFARLVQILKSCEVYGEEFRGVIFVQRRATAIVIADMLCALDKCVGFLRPKAIVSHRPAYQRDTFEAFESGKHNLLVVTKSMEDLNIPKTLIAIRFDPFESQISYAYARACLRGPECHVVHMIETGNDVHRRIISSISPRSDEMQSWIDKIGEIQSAIPPPNLHETTDPYRSDSEDEDDLGPCIIDPSTSGRIYHRDASTILHRFVASIAEHDDVNRPLFKCIETQDISSKYTCTVQFPGDIALKTSSGEPCSSFAEARRSACYHACLELFERGCLDYHLFPRPPYSVRMPGSSDSTMDPAQREHNKSNGTRRYPRRKPEFWVNCSSVTWDRLYPTVISTNLEDTRSHGPIVILTRLPLPSLASTKIFYTGVPLTIHFTRATPLSVDEQQLDYIYKYTIRLCHGIMNKSFVCPLQQMPYFFLPLQPSWTEAVSGVSDKWTPPNIIRCIPWDQVAVAANDFVVPLRPESEEVIAQDVEDALIQDRWVEFTRRYDVEALRTDLTPLSKPEDSPREAGYESFVDYCKVRRKGFEGLKNNEQPLIQVVRMPGVMNHLNPTSKPLTEPAKATAKYLIPELCAKYTIPASTFRMALLLPSITRRIDDMLLVKELNAKLFDHCVLEDALHIAITTPSAGFEFDYERLELLGDAYLKYLSSVYLFVISPEHHEGALHFARQKIISNRSLLEYADEAGLPPFIQSKPFVAKLWQPLMSNIIPNIGNAAPHLTDDISEGKESNAIVQASLTAPTGDATKSGKAVKRSKRQKQQDDQFIQWLGDKAVADVAEAIIGAAYITGGREVALKVTKALHIPVPRVDRWSDFGRKALAPPADAYAKLKKGSIETVERIIGHKFNRPHLIAQALTHASVPGHEMTSYERLEFLGDAILDFMVIRHLYYREIHLSPGGLTLLKGAMVSNSALAAVCIWSGLHEHLLFESHDLAKSIRAYEERLKINQAQEYDLARNERRAPGQYWLDIEPPKALSDVVESVIGAVYISDNFSPVGSEALFENVLKPFYDKHITLKTLSHHPTKILFELLQAQGCHDFEIVKEQVSTDEAESINDRSIAGQQITRCEVLVHDTVLASAESSTSQSSSRTASLCALDALDGDPEFMIRTCDCRAQTQARKAVKKTLKEAWEGDGDE